VKTRFIPIVCDLQFSFKFKLFDFLHLFTYFGCKEENMSWSVETTRRQYRGLRDTPLVSNSVATKTMFWKQRSNNVHYYSFKDQRSMKLREIDFLLKNLLINSTASPRWRLITWNHARECPDHREVMKGRTQTPDSSKACGKSRAFNCCLSHIYSKCHGILRT